MAVIEPVYRATIRASRSVDATEATLLVADDGPELVRDPGFEDGGFGAWLADNAAWAVVNNAGQANNGSYSLQLAVDAERSCHAFGPIRDALGRPILWKVEEGDELDYGGWVWSNVGGVRGAGYRAEYFAADKSTVVRSVVTPGVPHTATWTQLTRAGTVAATEEYVAFHAYQGTGSGAGDLRFDDATLIIRPAAKFATKDIAGYHPLLGWPTGRRGAIDVISKRTDIGEVRVDLLDQRLPVPIEANADRIFTSLIGDAGDGNARLAGLRVEIESSEDDGATWADWYTGRIEEVTQKGRIEWEIRIRDLARDLDIDVWTGIEPSITYADRPALLPLAFVKGQNFGEFPKQHWLQVEGKGAVFLKGPALNVKSHDFARSDNIVTERLERLNATVDATAHDILSLVQIHVADVYIRRLSNSETGRFRFLGYSKHSEGGAIASILIGEPTVGPYIDEWGGIHPRQIVVSALTDTGHPDYRADSWIVDGVDYELCIVPNGPARDDQALTVNDTAAGTLIAALLDGEFSYLDPDGTPIFSIDHVAATLTTMAADLTIPKLRGLRTQIQPLPIALSEICQAIEHSWFMNASGELDFVDLRLPTSTAGLVTLDSVDIDNAIQPIWRASGKDALAVIEAEFYIDRHLGKLGIEDGQFGAYPKLNAGGLEEPAEGLVIVGDFGDKGVGHRKATLKAEWFRSQELERDDDDLGLRTRRVGEDLARTLSRLRGPFGRGSQTLALGCRRTADVTGLQLGTLCFVNLDALPNPTTNRRGGIRLYRVIEIVEERVHRFLTLLDTGVGTQATVPSMGALTLHDTNQIDIPVTLNADGDRVILEAAVTDLTVTVIPAATAASWRHIAEVLTTSTYTHIAAQGTRTWFRIRSEPLADVVTGAYKLPSDWVNSSGYQQVDAINPPTSLAEVVGYDVTEFTWTNDDDQWLVEFWLEEPVNSNWFLVTTLRPGTARFRLYGQLDASTSYNWRLRAVSPDGGVSAFSATGSFTTLASGTIPALIGVSIVQGTFVGTA